MEAVPSTSGVNSIIKMQKVDYDKLPTELHGMKIQDNKANKGDDDKVIQRQLGLHGLGKSFPCKIGYWITSFKLKFFNID